MRKLALRFCIACLTVAATLSAEESIQGTSVRPKEKLDVYLLIGQSNMAGRAPYGKEDAGPIDRCYLLDDKDQWEPARNPLNRHSTIRKALKFQKMGPGYGFSKAMLEKNKGISIGLVVNARGGTSIEEWKKGSQYYNEALSRTKEAQKTGTLKGILWHQGESDSQMPNEYLEKLKNLISDLRRDLDMAELPFVAGQVFYHAEKKSHTKQLNDQIAKLPAEVPFTGCVSSDNLTTLDDTHFDSPGMKLLGQRYAEEMLRVQAQ